MLKNSVVVMKNLFSEQLSSCMEHSRDEDNKQRTHTVRETDRNTELPRACLDYQVSRLTSTVGQLTSVKKTYISIRPTSAHRSMTTVATSMAEEREEGERREGGGGERKEGRGGGRGRGRRGGTMTGRTCTPNPLVRQTTYM